MEPDLIAVIQNQDSPFTPLVGQAIAELNLQAQYRSFPLSPPADPALYPSLILWDLSGFPDEQCFRLARSLRDEQCGLLLICPEPNQICEQTMHDSGALGNVVLPRSANELAVALKVAMATFKRLVALRNDLSRADRDLKERKEIDEAKRRIMRQTGCSEAEAMRRLQNQSRNTNTKLAELARRVLLGHPLYQDGAKGGKGGSNGGGKGGRGGRGGNA